MVKNLPASEGATGDEGSITGSGRSPAEGNGYPLQYSCLKNPMDRGTWGGYSPLSHTESDDWACVLPPECKFPENRAPSVLLTVVCPRYGTRLAWPIIEAEPVSESALSTSVSGALIQARGTGSGRWGRTFRKMLPSVLGLRPLPTWP